MRERVIAEEPRCRFCGKRSTDADHITPRSSGGSDDRANLRGLCHQCHSRRTLNDFNAARRR